MKTGLTLMLLIVPFVSVNADTGLPETESVERYCVYAGSGGEDVWQGRCTEFFNYSTGEHRVLWKEHDLRLADYEPPRHELPWILLTIDGNSAMGFMHHRSWVSYTTLDLGLMLDVCNQADESGACH